MPAELGNHGAQQQASPMRSVSAAGDMLSITPRVDRATGAWIVICDMPSQVRPVLERRRLRERMVERGRHAGYGHRERLAECLAHGYGVSRRVWGANPRFGGE